MIGGGLLEKAGLERWVAFKQVKVGLGYRCIHHDQGGLSRLTGLVLQVLCGIRVEAGITAGKGTEGQMAGVWNTKVTKRTLGAILHGETSRGFRAEK